MQLSITEPSPAEVPLHPDDVEVLAEFPPYALEPTTLLESMLTMECKALPVAG
jgi:hypothetical protein